MADYYNVTTNQGDAEITAAIASNTKLAITHIAFGDGNGSVPTPSKTRTSLVREVHRQAVTKYERHVTNANWIVIETIIPSHIGGFWVREMGIIANGKLISHGSHAPFEKVADPSGVSEYRLKFTQDVRNGNVVSIKLDESLIYASQAWVNENYIPRSNIVDNLITNDPKKPLSAAQGKKLQDIKVNKVETSADGSIARYQDLIATQFKLEKVKGAVVIHLPVSRNKTNTMLLCTLRGYNYNLNNGAWELRISGYSSYTWLQYSANITGLAPFSQVQLAQASDHQVIILGTPDTVWSYPSVALTEVLASYLNFTGWETGYNIAVETDLSMYTGVVTPSLYGAPRTINGITFDSSKDIEVPAKVNQITAAVDLNTLQEPGFYSCELNSIATLCKNTPVNAAFSLLVEKHAGYSQTFTDYSGSPKVYKRNKVGTTWETWFRIYSSVDPQPNINGNAGTATKLATPRTVSFSGAATGSYSYDGSGDSSCILTLANSGVVEGTYSSTIQIPSLTVNTKGQITGISQNEIRSASVNQTGVVQLVDDLVTNNATRALTARQGKIIQDALNTKVSKDEINYSSLRTLRFDTEVLSSTAVFKLSFTPNFDGNVEVELGCFGQHAYSGKIVVSGSFNTHSAGIYRQYLQCIEEVGNLSPYFYIDPTLYYEGVGLPCYILIYKKAETTGARLTVTVRSAITPNADYFGLMSLTDVTATVPLVTNQTNKVTINTTGNAGTATKLATPRTVSFSGAATGSYSYDGSGDSSCILTLANSGVAAGTYSSTIQIPSLTVNTKGQITGVSQNDIRSASVTQTGVVQLVDDLVTNNATKALTAKQGVLLNNSKMNRGEFGFGSGERYATENPAATASRETLQKTQMYSFINEGQVSYGQGLGWSVGTPDYSSAKAHFLIGGLLNNNLYHVAVDDISKPEGQRTVLYNYLYSTAHAEFDGKGYLRQNNQNTDVVITTDINRYSQALYETKLFSPNATKYFYVTDNDFGMWNAATNETVPLAPRCGGTGRRDGNIDGNAATASVLKATDERSLRPGNVTGGALKFSFSTLSENNQAVDFCDFLSFNSYVDGSGGFVNALAISKYDHQIWHYQGNFGADTWSAKKRLAYVDENVASASKLQNARTVSFSGAATGSFSYDGSGNSSCVLTLANSGVEAGTYASTIEIPSITVNQKGQVTGISKQPIRSASVTQTGVVQLVDDLTTDDNTKALTAKQGKKLYDTLNQMANKPDIRACISFNSISNQFINNFGFTSVTNLGGGLFEFTLSTPVPDANYSIFTTVSQFREATSATIDAGFAQTTTKFRIRCLWGGDNTTGSFNPAILNVHITY